MGSFDPRLSTLRTFLSERLKSSSTVTDKPGRYRGTCPLRKIIKRLSYLPHRSVGGAGGSIFGGVVLEICGGWNQKAHHIDHPQSHPYLPPHPEEWFSSGRCVRAALTRDGAPSVVKA
jgi:hypothetical protein